jgi:hypothetical protein
MLQPPETETAAHGWHRSGGKWKTNDEQTECSGPDSELQAFLERLEVIADWKERLQERIGIARLKFDLLDADLDFSDLQQEVAEFNRVCRRQMWRAAA